MRQSLSCVRLRLSLDRWQPARGQQPECQYVSYTLSGPSGSDVNGTFVLTSNGQSSIATMTEIIVLFERDGLPGPHRLVAQWRSQTQPLNSAIDYVAAQRFGAYTRCRFRRRCRLALVHRSHRRRRAGGTFYLE